jgi:hypothetical protein
MRDLAVHTDLIGGALRYTVWVKDPPESCKHIIFQDEAGGLWGRVLAFDYRDWVLRQIEEAYPHLRGKGRRPPYGCEIHEDDNPGVVSFLETHKTLERALEAHWEKVTQFESVKSLAGDFPDDPSQPLPKSTSSD